MSAQEFKNQVARVSHSSNTFHKLGTFMEENWVSVGMLSATEVAKRAGVSQGSVTRFCNELGFAGFRVDPDPVRPEVKVGQLSDLIGDIQA